MERDDFQRESTLQAELDAHTSPAAPALYRQEEDGKLQCTACAHRCRLAPDHRGICRMRYHYDGKLYRPSGYVAGLQVDPIEKKPFYHVLPGSGALSFGMLGCNFHCSFCQNWTSSQTLRDRDALAGFQCCTADTIVAGSLKQNVASVVSTYNEPLITADWAMEVFERAHVHPLLCGFVSNGYATPEVLEFLRPVLDFCNVDLKCFSEEGYRCLGGKLKPVLDSIECMLTLGIWVEVVTLVVPGFNDAPGELEQSAAFLASMSADIPWHVTAFYPTYKMTDRPPTSASLIERAWEIGKEAGLHYVYAGNMAGRVGDRENTCCPGCGTLLIARRGFQVLRNLLADGRCPQCNRTIRGRWNKGHDNLSTPSQPGGFSSHFQ